MRAFSIFRFSDFDLLLRNWIFKLLIYSYLSNDYSLGFLGQMHRSFFQDQPPAGGVELSGFGPRISAFACHCPPNNL